MDRCLSNLHAKTPSLVGDPIRRFIRQPARRRTRLPPSRETTTIGVRRPQTCGCVFLPGRPAAVRVCAAIFRLDRPRAQPGTNHWLKVWTDGDTDAAPLSDNFGKISEFLGGDSRWFLRHNNSPDRQLYAASSPSYAYSYSSSSSCSCPAPNLNLLNLLLLATRLARYRVGVRVRVRFESRLLTSDL